MCADHGFAAEQQNGSAEFMKTNIVFKSMILVHENVQR